jgi:hypothetical protein
VGITTSDTKPMASDSGQQARTGRHGSDMQQKTSPHMRA